VVDLSGSLSMTHVPVRTTTVVMNVATIDEMTVIEMTVTKKKDTAVIAQGHPVALNMMNVARPGLRPPGGRLMIKSLQGTIRTDAETTEDATKKTSASMRGRGTQMGKDGRVSGVQ